ncbi:hypothetical protein JZO76_11660 [Enterococcus sp. MJM12]|uniref:FtsX-like permease family protein n=1 Tax=Candidatus Enterococcus myersii TaxID=2815322 RepID=A0ABS3H9P8_9ENTE|nr:MULTISPECIES: hypothetical protein [Enterococcus]MBO0450178.1 hypothetical protein [Enterococcus sp. MJM12]MCD1023860.1 hypothetical protein [Enterococcus sp. SMC-9]MDT2739681.1 hypothetical protein [Enterococcus canintestini]
MRTVHYAVASLRYHKKIYLPYFIVLVLLTVALFFALCLVNSAQAIYYGLQDLLANNPINENKQWSAPLQFFFTQMKNIYWLVVLGTVSLLTLFTFLFSGHAFTRRKRELQTFFTSGRSHLRVALQIAYEFVLPALFIVGCLICLVLIFQPLVQRLCELIHTHTAQIIRSNDLANLNNNIKFGVRLPKDYPLLIQTVFISNRDWLQIFTKTAWQTLLLLLINFGIGLPLGALLAKIRLLKKSIN